MTQEIVPQKIGPSKTVSHFMKPQTAQHPSPMTEQTLDMLAISSHLPQVGSLTQESHDIDTCIHNLFESQVGRTPDAIAIYFEDTHLTYLQLNEYANQLAHYLRAVDPDIGPSTFVGIHLDRSLGMLASILAVLKIGAAYLPLDPALPPARLDYILSNTQPSVLLSHTDYADQLSAQTLAGFTHQIVCMDQLDTHLHGYATLNPASMVSPDELAYILYTSGSTGNPKGVEISHKTVINFLNSMQIRPGITDKDVMLALTTLSFDIAVLELFLPLTVGASLVLAPTAAARDAEQLQALIAGENTGVAVTIMQATPATWRMLLAMGWRGQTGLTMLCGGEAMPVALAEQLQTCGDVLWNLYGPTETTIWSTIYRVYPPEAALALPSELFNSHTVPIGYPIANTQIYVVDDTLQPVPNGTEGELLIGGAGLARGYHKRPDITAERFIDNPFGEGRVYRTGDLVRYPAIDMDSPPLEFLGRLDHQVKIRGFRVELGEIEAVLTAHDDVHEAVVMTYEGSDGSPLLAAYLIPTETNLAVDALPIFLRERLPAYMLPNTYIPLDAFPLTPNGKINRLALPKPQQKTPAVLPSSPSETPQTPLESTLVNLWQEILGVDTVGIHDNFFMLGGHSLLAAQFVTRAKAMGLAPTVQQLTQHPTIAELSVSLQTNSAAQSSLLVPIKPTGTKPPLFLIHPVLGMVYPFMPLAQYLHKEQPLYGIRASGIERGEPVLSSVPEVAVRYITEIQTVQPDGPYHLGGWSFGGWVAHEMATQLTAQGHEVGLLAMLDTPFRSPETPRLEILRRDLAFFRVLMREIVPYANSYRTLMAASDEPVSLFQQSMLTRVSRVYRANNQATRTYVPTDYDGDISVFRASQQFHAYDETMSWGANHARPVDVAHIPGNHMTIFREPHIQYLVEELQQRLS